MNRGIYTAATGMIHNQRRLDTISNNLANVNTTGFKRDMVISESFNDMLVAKINDSADFENHKAFTGLKQEENDGVYTVNINSGYFRVATPSGMHHSRDLKFTIDEQGYLKTFYKNASGEYKTDGENFIIGKSGKPIQIEDKEDFTIDEKGNVLSGGNQIDSLIYAPAANIIGTINGGVRADKVYTDFTGGELLHTDGELDFALMGEGFFKISDGENYFYTRDGSFSISDKGELVTKEGFYVVGEVGSIVVKDRDFTITENGGIKLDGELTDKLDIVNLENPEDLRKVGNNLYKILDNIEPKEIGYDGEIVKGALENSNVNSIREMVSMINVMRNYEASQKVIKNQDELLGKAVNDLGRV